MLLSLILLIPSLEIINEPPSLKFWLWLLFAASPLILSWLAIWNGFRKRDAGAGWFAGIVIAESMLGAAMILYFWPAPIQILFILILHIFPSLGYPMA
jgi:hypothetical protein